jgi:hypothetical protein
MARGQGGDPRLSLLPTPALIAALHALSLAREFELRAFEAVVGELARRAGQGVVPAPAPPRAGGALWALPFEGAAEARSEDALARPPPPTFWGRGSATDWVEAEAAAASAAAAAAARPHHTPHPHAPHPHLPFSRAPPFSDSPPPQPGAAEPEPPLDALSASRLHSALLTLTMLSPFPRVAERVPAALRAAAAAAAPDAVLAAAVGGGGGGGCGGGGAPLPARAVAAALLLSAPPGAAAAAAAVASPLPLLISHVTRVLRAALPEREAVGGGGGGGSGDAEPAPAAPRSLISILSRLSRLQWSGNALAAASARSAHTTLAEEPLEPSEEWEAPVSAARVAARARGVLDLLALPGLRRELRRVPQGQHGELLVQPLRPAACGILIHVALPMHRVALEVGGGPESAVAAPGGGGAQLSLRAQWRAGVLAAEGWRVVHVPVAALVGAWQWHAAVGRAPQGWRLRPQAGALSPLATAATLARLLPELQRT